MNLAMHNMANRNGQPVVVVAPAGGGIPQQIGSYRWRRRYRRYKPRRTGRKRTYKRRTTKKRTYKRRTTRRKRTYKRRTTRKVGRKRRYTKRNKAYWSKFSKKRTRKRTYRKRRTRRRLPAYVRDSRRQAKRYF